MSNNENISTDWILKANQDLGTAKLIYNHIPDYSDTIAFHCQQAAEKYLKALLIFLDLNFKKSHDLVYLIDILSEKINIPNELIDKALSMEGYGVQLRYPDHKILLSKEELEKAILTSEQIRSFVLSNLPFIKE